MSNAEQVLKKTALRTLKSMLQKDIGEDLRQRIEDAITTVAVVSGEDFFELVEKISSLKKECKNQK